MPDIKKSLSALRSMALAGGVLVTAVPLSACFLNPCAAKSSNPCSARASNPCGARLAGNNPYRAKNNPCAPKSNPCVPKGNPCSAVARGSH